MPLLQTDHQKEQLRRAKQALESGRWPLAQRRYPNSEPLVAVSEKSWTTRHCTAIPSYSWNFRLRKSRSPFPIPTGSDSAAALKQDVIQLLSRRGLHQHRTTNRTDVSIDLRLLDLLLRAADDPEVHLGTFAIGVRVGPGASSRVSLRCTLPRGNGACPNNVTPWIAPKVPWTVRLFGVETVHQWQNFLSKFSRCWKTRPQRSNPRLT